MVMPADRWDLQSSDVVMVADFELILKRPGSKYRPFAFSATMTKEYLLEAFSIAI